MTTHIIIVSIIAVCSLIINIKLWLEKPKTDKINCVKEWLKVAVTEVEKDLGSGTGQLKLRKVYSLAIKEFPFIMDLISFETFSAWVDEALDWMNNQLLNNKAIDNYIHK